MRETCVRAHYDSRPSTFNFRQSTRHQRDSETFEFDLASIAILSSATCKAATCSSQALPVSLLRLPTKTSTHNRLVERQDVSSSTLEPAFCSTYRYITRTLDDYSSSTVEETFPSASFPPSGTSRGLSRSTNLQVKMWCRRLSTAYH